jgi:hypothetical protein
MMRYVFKNDFNAFKSGGDADPQIIGEALADIAAEAGGDLTPKRVVDAARPDTHPLHRHFEWDNAAAAERYREGQARKLIQCITIERDEEPPAPAFVSIADRGRSYRPIDVVLKSVDLRKRVLAQAKRDLESFRARYRDLTDVCGLIESAEQKIDEISSREAA